MEQHSSIHDSGTSRFPSGMLCYTRVEHNHRTDHMLNFFFLFFLFNRYPNALTSLIPGKDKSEMEECESKCVLHTTLTWLKWSSLDSDTRKKERRILKLYSVEFEKPACWGGCVSECKKTFFSAMASLFKCQLELCVLNAISTLCACIINR